MTKPSTFLAPADLAGTRYVRVGWFQAIARQLDSSVSAAAVPGRMLRVGWLRRNAEGRIKATRPGFRDQLGLKFLLVPAGWEDALPGDGFPQVPAQHACAGAHAHEEIKEPAGTSQREPHSHAESGCDGFPRDGEGTA